MDKIEQFKSLFPLEFNVTQKIITEGYHNLYSVYCCIGALSLKKALGDNVGLLDYSLSWGSSTGYGEVNKTIFCITTTDDVNFMSLREPQKVTFIIKEEENG